MAEYDMNRNAGHTKEDNERKVTKVITGKAKTKPNEVRKVTSMLISDDASNVKSYVIRDVLIPTFKKTILDVVDMILFGGEGGSKRSRNDSRPPYRVITRIVTDMSVEQDLVMHLTTMTLPLIAVEMPSLCWTRCVKWLIVNQGTD